MATLTEDMEKSFDTNIAIGEYGTQLFWYNAKQTAGDSNATTPKFEYALPLVSGGEYGGDTESTDTPELDLTNVPKLAGRTILKDVELTANYTLDKYRRCRQILNNVNEQVYMEVFSDGSAMIYSGTAGIPTITGGTPRQINISIKPTNMVFIDNVQSASESFEGEKTLEILNNMLDEVVNTTNGVTTGQTTKITASSGKFEVPIDYTTVPPLRDWAFKGKKS